MFPRLHFGAALPRKIGLAESVKSVFHFIFRPVFSYSLRVNHEHSSRLEYANFAQQEVGPLFRLSCSLGETASVVQELSARAAASISASCASRSHDQPHREQVQPIRLPFWYSGIRWLNSILW